MENKFHGLPPLKRFKLMQQQQQQQEEEQLEDTVLVSSHLPAKKRKESRDSPLTTTFCLPAKKRVFAFHPNFIPQKPISPFDLNIEYNPQSNDEESDSQEVNDVPIATDSNNSTQITEDCPEKAQDEDEDEDEDGIECAVCQSTDGDPSNPIVFCDGCDLMVHTTCYGSPLTKGVPEGDWFCTQCLSSSKSSQIGDKKSSCCLCPVAGGALKPTIDGRWAHLVCALFVPEVFFTDPDGRDGIDCSKVPQRRWEQSCYVCKCAKGCAIDCSELKCEMAFHVTCGLKEELCIEYREGGRSKGGGGVVAGFCKDHTELWKKEKQTGKFKIVARDEHKK